MEKEKIQILPTWYLDVIQPTTELINYEIIETYAP